MQRHLLLTKTLLVSVFCFFSIFSSNAQLNTLFGVKGGFNASNVTGFGDISVTEEGSAGTTVSTKYKPGFHLGFVSQINITDHFFVQPELLYSLQGAKFLASVSMSGSSVSDYESTNLHYLQLPIYAGTKIATGQGLDILLGVGPYLGFGIASEDDFFGDSGIFRRFDVGLTAMGGIQVNKFQVTIGYDLGLIDLVNAPRWSEIKKETGLSSICNRNFKASVAYFF